MELNKKDFMNICQVNICNLSKVSQIPLEKYIFDHNIDILLVQETKMQLPPNLNNYLMESTPARGESLKEGGCAIYISNDIKQTTRLSDLEVDGLDIIWVLIKIGMQKMILGTAYIQPDNTDHMERFTDSCRRAQEYAEGHGLDGIVMAGDFNARDSWWNDRTTNKNGDILKGFIEKSKCSIISPGRDTFSCTNKEGKVGGSVIDLIICSESLSNYFECCTVDETPILRTGAPGRGHWPVLSKIRVNGAEDDRKKRSPLCTAGKMQTGINGRLL